MKEEILKLRKQGLSYKKIRKQLNCSLSTISYHCKNNNLNLPLSRDKKLPEDIIDKIITEKSNSKIKEVSKKYDVSSSTIRRYFKERGVSSTNNPILVCINCGKKIKRNLKKFCNRKCFNEYRSRKTYENYLNYPEEFCRASYGPVHFKRHFLIEQDNKCAICLNENTWNKKPLIFIMDHIDGDASNNRRENLRLICPNCDSQLDTFKSKNKNSARKERYLLLKH